MRRNAAKKMNEQGSAGSVPTSRFAFLLWLEQNWISLLSILLVLGGLLVSFGRSDGQKVSRSDVQVMIKAQESKCFSLTEAVKLQAQVQFLQKEVERNATDILNIERRKR